MNKKLVIEFNALISEYEGQINRLNIRAHDIHWMKPEEACKLTERADTIQEVINDVRYVLEKMEGEVPA